MANDWQQDELLLALHLYCRTDFGKLHSTNPEIIHLANIIGRTPSAVAMKAFDRHLISFDENFALVISQKLKQQANDRVIQDYFFGLRRKSIRDA